MVYEENGRADQGGQDKKGGSSVWKKIFWFVVLAPVFLINLLLLLFIISVIGMMFSSGTAEQVYRERVIFDGPADQKIAVINVDGMIDATQYDHFFRQLRRARMDANVRGVVVRVNSPGGTVSASDLIYNEINKYRAEENKPAVALMQGLATSGGYYGAVACERLIIEPTAITGSIGVIMANFVVQDLLEEKLGIRPVVLKAGERKDWPSPFREVSEEEKSYIQDKILDPTHRRFIEIVAAGREGLELEEVVRLADGSIYNAEEALENGLVDRIGYLEDAVAAVMESAEIDSAKVVEYRRPFGLGSLLFGGSVKGIELDKSTIYKYLSPDILYMWGLD